MKTYDISNVISLVVLYFQIGGSYAGTKQSVILGRLNVWMVAKELVLISVRYHGATAQLPLIWKCSTTKELPIDILHAYIPNLVFVPFSKMCNFFTFMVTRPENGVTWRHHDVINLKTNFLWWIWYTIYKNRLFLRRATSNLLSQGFCEFWKTPIC